MNDFNENHSVTAAGTTYSAVYVVEPDKMQMFFEAVVSAIGGTTPTLDITVQVSRDKETWTDLKALSQFTATGTDSDRAPRPLRYARFKVVAGGTTPTATIELFMQAVQGDNVSMLDQLDITNDRVASFASASANTEGTSVYLDLVATATPTAVVAAKSRLYGFEFQNTNASAVYVQMFDVAVASVTLGTTTPMATFLVPTSGESTRDFSVPIEFDTAMTYAVTTTANGSTAPGTPIVVQFIKV